MLHGVLGNIALVEHKRGAGLGVEPAVVGDEFLDELREQRYVGHVALVHLVEQGDLEFPRHQQRQSHLAQIVALSLAVAALRHRTAVIGRRQEREEIRRVVQQHLRVQTELPPDARCQGRLNHLEGRLGHHRHVVPKPRRGERRLVEPP